MDGSVTTRGADHLIGLLGVLVPEEELVWLVDEETIEVTEHGTPVARLVPFERPERPAILARLEAEGRLRPAKNPGYVPQRLHPVTITDPNPLTRVLLEDRESER